MTNNEHGTIKGENTGSILAAPEGVELDIKEVVAVLIKRWWIILLSTVICVVGAFCLFYRSYTPQYRATAKLFVNNSSLSLGGAKLSISSADISTSKALVNTYIEILKSRLTLNEVSRQLNSKFGYEPMKYATLNNKISCGAVEDTGIFYINVSDSDPDKAINIVNTIIDVLPDQIATIIDGTSVRTVERAEEAVLLGSESRRDMLVGALIGFVASCGAVILLDIILNDTISNSDWLRNNYSGIPVLAEIPDANVNRRGGKYYRSKYYRNKYYRNGSYGGGYYRGGYGYGRGYYRGYYGHSSSRNNTQKTQTDNKPNNDNKK